MGRPERTENALSVFEIIFVAQGLKPWAILVQQMTKNLLEKALLY